MKFCKSIFIILFILVTTTLLIAQPVMAKVLWGRDNQTIPPYSIVYGPWTGYAPSPEALTEKYCADLGERFVTANGADGQGSYKVTSTSLSGGHYGYYNTEKIWYLFGCNIQAIVLTPNPGHGEKAGDTLEWNPGGIDFAKHIDPINPSKSNKDSGETVGPMCRGNPIDVSTGEKFQIETDYRGTGPYPLVFQRLYNSHSNDSTSLGKNWRHNYDRKLLHTIEIGSDEFLTLTRTNGKRIYFSQSGTDWVGDVDIPSNIVRIPTGWELHTTSDEVETYDNSGKLISIRNRTGLTHTLAYDTDNRLSTVTDSFGKKITLSYDDLGRLATMLTPDDKLYTYTQTNTLTQVTYPDSTAREYLYTNNRLTGINDEKGNRFATWDYDTQGRAILSEHADGAERITIVYNADGTAMVTDTLGSTQTYHFANINGVRRVTQIDGGPCASCGGRNSQQSYDANGFLASKTDFNNNTTTYINNARGLEISRTDGVGTPQERIITTEWHRDFRLPTKITAPGKVSEFTYSINGQLLSRTERAVP